MSDKKTLNDCLEKIAGFSANNQLTKAQELLESLDSDPNNHLLGHITALGLPRRLHSAHLKLAKAQGDELKKIAYQYTLVPPPEQLKQYAHFTIDERRAINLVNQRPVPEKIHQIWIGSKPPPESTQAWKAHVSQHQMEYQLWREEDIQGLELGDDAAFSHMMAKGDLPGAVDVARYRILHRFGGIYLDCDWYPVRDDISFTDLLPMRGLIAMPEDTARKTGKGSLLLSNSFIASPAEHPIFERLTEAMDNITAQLPKAPAWWSTGPLVFTLMSRGGSVTIADGDFVAGQLPPGTPLSEVGSWCQQAREGDSGFLLAWRSWSR